MITVSRYPLRVLGCGMATAVGLNAPATCAAVRAGIAGFEDTEFQALGGEPITGAEVPLPKCARGLTRLAQLVVGPIRECLDVYSCSLREVPIFFGTSESTRPGRYDDIENGLPLLVEEIFGMRLHPLSRCLPLGRISGAAGIHEAMLLATEHGCRRVIVAGVDTYFVTDTLDHFEDCDRLITERNSNGFIPGEAAAAVLLGSDDDGPSLHILGLGFGVQGATILDDKPSRGEGIAKACAEALSVAQLGLHDIDYRIVHASGEHYWFKENALAVSRLMRVRREVKEVWTPADCLGETGAAAVPCLISIAWWAACKRYSPGPLVLLQAGNDDGRRVALVLYGSDVISPRCQSGKSRAV